MDLPRKFHANFMCLVRGVSYCNEEAVKPEEFYHRQYQGRRGYPYHVIIFSVSRDRCHGYFVAFFVLICFSFRYAA